MATTKKRSEPSYINKGTTGKAEGVVIYKPGKPLLKKLPSEAQLKARAKFAEQAKNRAGFTMTAKINDQVFTCKTKDLDEAIQTLGLNILSIRTRLVLRISQGKKLCERLLYVPQAKMLFRNRVFRAVFIKRLIFK
jgi:hypothetical protein